MGNASIFTLMQQQSLFATTADAPGVAIRAISLTQPWATLVAIGAKSIETRSWPTGYRGMLAIHAAKRFSDSDQRLCFREPFTTALMEAGFQSPSQLPRGMVIAVGRLVNCRQVTRSTELPARSSREWAFGDFDLGRWLWDLDNVEPLDPPVPAKGALGLWDWRPD